MKLLFRGYRPRMNPTSPTVSGYLVITAEDAGSADRQAVRQALEVLAAEAPTELRTTRNPQDLETALDGLAGRRLVLAGGDGSLHLVVSALLARGVAASTPLGLLPLGTGNDLAQSLGLPLDPTQAARRVVTGQVTALDMLRHDEGTAVNAAHVGFGVAAARHAQRLKPVLGVLAYRLGAVWAGVTQAGVETSVAVDGRTVCGEQPVLLLAVMNGSFIGGDTPLCPPADPCDGLLDVLVVADRGRHERAAFALALARGRHLGLPGVTYEQGRQVTVRAAAETWNVDGELLRTPAELEWRVRSAAWQVVT